jgi:hypothetical protein
MIACAKRVIAFSRVIPAGFVGSIIRFLLERATVPAQDFNIVASVICASPVLLALKPFDQPIECPEGIAGVLSIGARVVGALPRL